MESMMSMSLESADDSSYNTSPYATVWTFVRTFASATALTFAHASASASTSIARSLLSEYCCKSLRLDGSGLGHVVGLIMFCSLKRAL